MPCIRLLAASVVVLGCAGLALVAPAGCTFKLHPDVGNGNGTGGASGPPIDAGDGTGGTVSTYDGPTYISDAPREYVFADDAPGDVTISADANCGNQPFTVVSPPPDLLIVLDRSGSMNEDSMGRTCRPNCGVNSKWSQVTAAINTVVGMTETKINWGLKFFGNDDVCGVTDGAAVAPGLMNAMAISAAIAAPANQPASKTPTALAELSAGAYLKTVSDTNPKFILLATDGAPNCGANAADINATDSVGATAAVTSVKDLGFPTFVIGISTSADTETTLNDMAVNGGYPRAGMTPQYYPVTNSAELVTALGAIQTITTGMCTYPLGDPAANADMSKVTVTVDGVASIQDDTNGWHYDPGMKSITFTGTTCSQLMAGTLRNVQVLYGCKVSIT